MAVGKGESLCPHTPLDIYTGSTLVQGGLLPLSTWLRLHVLPKDTALVFL